MVTENDSQWRLENGVGLIKDVRRLQVAIGVALNRNAQGTGENGLIGGEPAEAVVGQDGQYLWTDCPLRGPHPQRCLTEGSFVGFDGQAYLFGRVFGVTERRVRQGHGRAGAVCRAAVNEQGQDRMIVG